LRRALHDDDVVGRGRPARHVVSLAARKLLLLLLRGVRLLLRERLRLLLLRIVLLSLQLALHGVARHLLGGGVVRRGRRDHRAR